MSEPVQIRFDCVPLRSVSRCDAPLDAPQEIKDKCLRIAAAVQKHGRHNSYFLHNASCVFHLTNDAANGCLEFVFEGVVLADESDRRTSVADLAITLQSETCSWLTQPVVSWFAETVRQAVIVEFDRYMEAGDLERTAQRMLEMESTVEANSGYVGMYL